MAETDTCSLCGEDIPAGRLLCATCDGSGADDETPAALVARGTAAVATPAAAIVAAYHDNLRKLLDRARQQHDAWLVDFNARIEETRRICADLASFGRLVREGIGSAAAGITDNTPNQEGRQ